MQQHMTEPRPWPVYALVLLSAIGLVWGAIVDPDRNWSDFAGLLFTAWITYSLWAGKRWAFTLSFMGATLVAGLVVVILAMQVFLLERGIDQRLLLVFLGSAAWIALLLHPSTKEFAGLREASGPHANATKA